MYTQGNGNSQIRLFGAVPSKVLDLCQSVPLEIVFHAINRSENVTAKFSSTSALSSWTREPWSHKLRWKHHWFLRYLTIMVLDIVLLKRIYLSITEKTLWTSSVVAWFYYGLIKDSENWCPLIKCIFLWQNISEHNVETRDYSTKSVKELVSCLWQRKKLKKTLSVVF